MTAALDLSLPAGIGGISRRRAGIVALAVLVVAAAVLTGWLASRPEPGVVKPAVQKDGSYTVGTIAGEADQAVQSAVDVLPAALSFDFRSLDESLSSATAGMTESFAEEFSATFDKTARPMAEDKSAVTNTLVRGAGLVRLDGERAVCLVYVDQVLVSSDTAKNKPLPVQVSQNRVTVDLVRVDGDWKVDGITPF